MGMKRQTIDVMYEHGVLRLKSRHRLPLRDHTPLKLTIIWPASPVARTRGIIRVSPRTARAILAGDETEFYGA